MVVWISTQHVQWNPENGYLCLMLDNSSTGSDILMNSISNKFAWKDEYHTKKQTPISLLLTVLFDFSVGPFMADTPAGSYGSSFLTERLTNVSLQNNNNSIKE